MAVGDDPMSRKPRGLPLHEMWKSEDEYVESLLSFATGSDLFRNLCGGVHILDFLTREPDLYTYVLPQDWRDWFELVSIDDVLDLLMRADLSKFKSGSVQTESIPSPPQSLLEYIDTVRTHSLRRDFRPVSDNIADMPRHIAVGMKTKKAHEVTNFAAYVGSLSAEVSERLGQPVSVVDFGSGQNYLGRTLATPPYNQHVIAIEKRHHNIVGANRMDVHAKLAKKEKIMRNKKEYKRQLAMNNGMPTPPPEQAETDLDPVLDTSLAEPNVTYEQFGPGKGSMTYVEHEVQDGYLENILTPATLDINATYSPNANHNSNDDLPEEGNPTPCCSLDRFTSSDRNSNPEPKPKAMVISLHSCGNLSHHGLRSLVLNPSVAATAIIGCCYNLLTERLGPATYKLPQLRPNHPRLEATGNAHDPHGFPMSRTLETFPHADGVGVGVKLNITARMMAVQAPYNWGPEDSEAFFRRHFYRTLLQRILLDVGVVKQCSDPAHAAAGGSITGRDESGTPLIVGSLRKSCFTSFKAYVHGALAKLTKDPVDGPMIAERTKGVTDEVVDQYEQEWGYAKKHLAVIWSLMAFSAGVVESIIVTDRWLYLREQPCVQDCWVDIVFDYKHSPRNFVVVGIKKPEEQNEP
ncbi:hypothetical protein PV08_02480 [Exophiala spinifera]|uniref:Methyltransferase domain-containing protein n=1 Tax=Exophiala spinifera TaxID=91928 RepID=A0A0D1ZZN9_9EURO|nr:uncharacterized protein PV08_02480 [Exophiala spinifera]KIW18192.1 hypothetical protein PV08_02480 [Exophiala spinifera]